jgi:SAM-dependent methyltransferase
VLDADHPLRRRLRPIRRLASSTESIWRRGLPLEVEFWTKYLQTRGGEFPEEFRERLDPGAVMADPLILEAIAATNADPVRILDVGAGPLTALGKRDPHEPARNLEIVAIDPLANAYDRLLHECGITPPVRTRQCRGEDIVGVFGRQVFDIGYARNSLDHSIDPMVVIENLVEAVKPGGTIVLRHYRREGETMRYEQLHQWNFDVEDGRLVVWGKRRRYDISGRLAGRATVIARIQPGAYHADLVEASILVAAD